MTAPLTDDEMEKIVEELHVWTFSPVTCTICGHKHVSVHVAGIERVECPNCHYMTEVEE